MNFFKRAIAQYNRLPKAVRFTIYVGTSWAWFPVLFFGSFFLWCIGTVFYAFHDTWKDFK